MFRRAFLASVALAAAAFPSTASAVGEYQQQLCLGSAAGRTALYPVGHAGVSLGCAAGAPYPGAGVYGNTPTLTEQGWHAVQADAPPGARYTALRTNLRVPYQAFNRNTWIEDGVGYAWQDHNAYGGGFTFNPMGNVFGVSLRNSPWLRIGQSCSGSPGQCAAGDWYLDVANATLYDATAPVVAPADSGLFARGRAFFRGSVPVTADLIDEGKGPQAARVSVDGAVAAADAWPDSTCDFRLANPCASRLGWSRALDTAAYADGEHSVRVSADDGLANVGAAERTVTFDNTAPEPKAGGRIDGRSVTAAGTDVPVAASDATSGVARVEALVDAGPWQPAAGAVRVTGTGTHRVRVRAVDRAGNVSPDAAVSFTLQAVPANQRLVARGEALECDPGAPWSQGTAFTYLWLRDGAVIDGAGGRSFTPGPEDAGRRIGCRAIAANEAGETLVESPALVVAGARAPEPAPVFSSPPEPPAVGLTARFEGGRTLTIRWGEKHAVAGTLLRADGRALAGATVRASSAVLTPGALPQELPPLTTDAAGRFRLAVGTGPSRTLTFRHEQLVHAVTVRVIPRVTLAARGGRVSGRVEGATSRTPNSVALQVLRRGAWRTVKTVRLRAGGRFEGHVGGRGLRLRALVRAAPGWPFETGRSRAILTE